MSPSTKDTTTIKSVFISLPQLIFPFLNLFVDQMMYEDNMDLSALAGSYTPIPHSSNVVYDDPHEEDRPPSRGSAQRRAPKSHPTLADFTKQRQQMAQLEEQFSIPNLTELKRQELADRDRTHRDDSSRGTRREYDEDERTPNKADLWNLSSEHEYRDEIYDDDQPEPGMGVEDEFEGGDEEDYDPRIFSEIQAAREKEFLELFCERLSGYPEEIAVSIIDELADRLRLKVRYFLFFLSPSNHHCSSPAIWTPSDLSLIPINLMTRL